MLYSALNVSSKIIREFDACNTAVSNLKLQKVLYYVQMKCLQDTRSVAFGDKIEAWRHGPVVREVYSTYKNYVAEGIDMADPAVSNNDVDLCPAVNEIIIDIVKRTASIDAWELVERTHQTEPWKQYYRISYSNVIPVDVIKEGVLNI